MSSGRWLVEGSGAHWHVTDLADSTKPVAIHRTRADAQAQVDRLEAKRQRVQPRPAPQQAALFDSKEA